MIKPELYHKTVGILYDAYFKDLLKHGDCSACAVGNICAGNGIPRLTLNYVDENNYYNNASWSRVFQTTRSCGQIVFADELKEINIQRVIDSTGYSWQELAKIEKAFELADRGINSEDYMFNGLVAVLEVLKEIHQVTDEDLLQANNKRFKDHYAARVGAIA